MSTSVPEPGSNIAQSVSVKDDFLTVSLTDGRSLSVPLAWFPRLQHGTPEERNHWRLIGRGDGIHWPDLDEDISVSGLVAGRPSGESARSLERWLQARERTSPTFESGLPSVGGPDFDTGKESTD